MIIVSVLKLPPIRERRSVCGREDEEVMDEVAAAEDIVEEEKASRTEQTETGRNEPSWVAREGTQAPSMPGPSLSTVFALRVVSPGCPTRGVEQ